MLLPKRPRELLLEVDENRERIVQVVGVEGGVGIWRWDNLERPFR